MRHLIYDVHLTYRADIKSEGLNGDLVLKQTYKTLGFRCIWWNHADKDLEGKELWQSPNKYQHWRDNCTNRISKSPKYSGPNDRREILQPQSRRAQGGGGREYPKLWKRKYHKGWEEFAGVSCGKLLGNSPWNGLIEPKPWWLMSGCHGFRKA